jgi:hypothetical protein
LPRALATAGVDFGASFFFVTAAADFLFVVAAPAFFAVAEADACGVDIGFFVLSAAVAGWPAAMMNVASTASRQDWVRLNAISGVCNDPRCVLENALILAVYDGRKEHDSDRIAGRRHRAGFVFVGLCNGFSTDATTAGTRSRRSTGSCDLTIRVEPAKGCMEHEPERLEALIHRRNSVLGGLSAAAAHSEATCPR